MLGFHVTELSIHRQIMNLNHFHQTVFIAFQLVKAYSTAKVFPLKIAPFVRKLQNAAQRGDVISVEFGSKEKLLESWKCMALGDASLDEKMRGFIESMMDEMIEQGNVVGVLTFLREELPTITSFGDLVIGYIVGMLMSIAVTGVSMGKKSMHYTYVQVISEKDMSEITEMIRQRLPKIMVRVIREMNMSKRHFPDICARSLPSHESRSA
jgi:hypothetical protein